MEEKLYCRHCGKQIASDSQFCQHCGGKVENGLLANETKEESEPIKIEIVKSAKVNNGDNARSIVKTCLKEILILSLFVGFAFMGRFLFHNIFIQSNQPPIVSEEKQQAFNDAIFKLEHPNGLPPIDDYINDTYDEKEYPTIHNYSFGIPAAELGVGEYKYDSEAYSMSDLQHINDFRRAVLESHAKNNAQVFFWILLIGLPLLRYIFILSKWLFK